MPDQVIVCGSTEQQIRFEAYSELLGSEHVSVSSAEDVRAKESLIVDVRGTMKEKAHIGDWIKSGAFVITDTPAASSVHTSQEYVSSGHLLVAQPSRYDPRHRLLQAQLNGGQIGDLVAVRWISLWPDDCWLPEGVTENYAFNVLDSAVALTGVPKRIMARLLRLKRDVPDTLFVTMVAEDTGAIAYLEISCCQPPGRRVERIEVVGRAGMLEYDSDANRTLRLITGHGPVLRDAFWEPPLLTMLSHYIAALDDQSKLAATVDEMSKALSVLERTAESVRTNVPC